jgi:hypothetical protein
MLLDVPPPQPTTILGIASLIALSALGVVTVVWIVIRKRAARRPQQ